MIMYVILNRKKQLKELLSFPSRESDMEAQHAQALFEKHAKPGEVLAVVTPEEYHRLRDEAAYRFACLKVARSAKGS